MGRTQNTKHIMLSLFNQGPFPSMAPLSRSMIPAFHSTRIFQDIDARRSDFLSDMQIQSSDAPNTSQSYSYSSSTVQHGDNAPVTQRREEYRTGDGEVISRSRKSVGDQSVEEILKGGETTRTLTNISEDDLERFEQSVSERQDVWSPFTTHRQCDTSNALTAPLEEDLARIRH